MIISKILVLFIIMFIGYIASRKSMLTGEVCKKLSSIIVNIANPAIIINSVTGCNIKISSNDLLITAIVAGGMYFALIILAELMIFVLRIERANQGMYRVMMVFSNIGYMGFPIIQSIYGAEAMVYASIFQIPFNCLIYTYGILVMKNNKSTNKKFKIRTILNNGVIACITMLAILIFKIHLPSMITDTVSSVAGMVVPLSMMIIGASLADIKLKDIVAEKKLLVFSTVKMILIPIIGYGILKCFVPIDMLVGVTLIMLATPIGSLTAMLAQEYGGDASLASKGIAFTTIATVITLPLIFAITGV